MKESLVLLVLVLLSSASEFTITRVSAFCRDFPSSSSSSLSSSTTQHRTTGFGISISPLPASLNDHNGKNSDNNCEEDENNKKKSMAVNMNDISNKARPNDKDSLATSKLFASGDELRVLREDLKSLRQNLEWAKALDDDVRIESLEKAIYKGESRDPSYMYDKAQKIIKEAKKMMDVTDEEKNILIDKWSSVATDAREFLPHLNMEGLWVGNYGDAKGLQVINITYSGDELIASKVTGDLNVPRGEKTFTVNMQPSNSSLLPPVELVNENRRGEFHRFPGKGQVSRKGFKDNRFVEGQMILFENRFSFVWIPTKHHVLFHRPSPEMTLKLLRDIISKEDEIENMRNHISRCFDMDLSTAIARQNDPFTTDEPLRRITTQAELEKVEEQVKESDCVNIFYQINKWRNYIDQVLDKKSR